MRLLQEAHLEAEDFSDKIVVIIAPLIVCGVRYIMGSLLGISYEIIFLRVIITLAIEILTDVWKNGVFWYIFGILPTRIRILPLPIDLVEISLAVMSTCNMFFAGTMIYTRIR
jgi:hypothetical protein